MEALGGGADQSFEVDAQASGNLTSPGALNTPDASCDSCSTPLEVKILTVTDTRVNAGATLDTSYSYYDCNFDLEASLDPRQAWYNGKIVTLQYRMAGPNGEDRWYISFDGGGSVGHMYVPANKISRIPRATKFQ